MALTIAISLPVNAAIDTSSAVMYFDKMSKLLIKPIFEENSRVAIKETFEIFEQKFDWKPKT
jgi:hypothetical protein